MTLTELSKKDVIQAVGGENLGRIDDLEIDEKTAQVRAAVLFGRRRWFGLLGREPDLTIPWESIRSVGTDVVMVEAKVDENYQPKPRHRR